MRRSLAVITCVTSLSAIAALASPASAETTNATFTLTGTASDVTISVPSGTVNLGSTGARTGAWTGLPLGTVTVTDDRSKLLPQWTVAVSASDFVLAGGSGAIADQHVAASAISYAPGTATLTGAGTGTYTPAAAASLAAPAPVGAYVGVSGSRVVSWSPTIGMTLTGQLAGTYSGTITHSLTVIS